MQVMPSTATGLLNKKGQQVIPLDLHEPKTGIGYGAQYLAHVISRYSSLEEALAAYNAGPTPVKRWQSRPGSFFENIGYLETRNYVLKVLLDYKMYADLY
jgi:soluble lytic murein transglycosylase